MIKEEQYFKVVKENIYLRTKIIKAIKFLKEKVIIDNTDFINDLLNILRGADEKRKH